MLCFHDRLREFTFQSGAVIKMCPDCTTFDNKRRDILRSGRVEVPKAAAAIHWGLLVEKAGIDVTNDGLDWWLTYTGDASGTHKASEEAGYIVVADVFGKLQDIVVKRSEASKRKPTDLDDHEHVQRFGRFEHSQAMPRRFNSYCTSCTDVVVDKSRNKVRVTKGVYLPIEHECAAVRVYNLSGELLEVKAI